MAVITFRMGFIKVTPQERPNCYKEALADEQKQEQCQSSTEPALEQSGPRCGKSKENGEPRI